MKAKDIMSTKVLTAGKSTTVGEIARLMADNGISGVPVIDDDGRIVGIVTQKDLLYKDKEPRFPGIVEILGGLIFLEGVTSYNEELKKLTAATAEDIMTRDVVMADPETEVERIAGLMVEHDINMLPVADNGKLVGIVSRTDMVKYIAKMME